jgi:hypothetical protein
VTSEKISKEADCEISMISEIEQRMRTSVHKRRLPQIPKLGFKTPGFDWREF